MTKEQILEHSATKGCKATFAKKNKSILVDGESIDVDRIAFLRLGNEVVEKYIFPTELGKFVKVPLETNFK